MRVNKLTWEKLVTMIKEINEKELGLDGFMNLLSLEPTETEKQIVATY